MGVGGALQSLGRYLEACERSPGVSSVSLDGDGGAPGVLSAALEVTVSTCPSTADQALTMGDVSIADDGRIRATVETAAGVLPEPPESVDLAVSETSTDGRGNLAVTLVASAGTDTAPGASAAEGEPASPGTTDRPTPTDDATTANRGRPRTGEGDGVGSTDRDVPPFRNHALLQEVYDSCGTFAEMAETLEMDVTGETVRRYMIDAGIHEPRSYDTRKADTDRRRDGTEGESGGTDEEHQASEKLQATEDVTNERPRAAEDREPTTTDSDEDLDTPVVIADGIGLPEGVQVDTLVETVTRSNTIYEVKTALGIERAQAVELLQRLDLHDHVVGRLARVDEREVTRETIIERLREHATAG